MLPVLKGDARMLAPMGFFVAVDPEILRRHAELILDALSKARIGATKAAIHQDIDARQYARQLAGEGHLSYTRMVRLPLKFWQWFFLLGCELVGLPEEVERSVLVQDGIDARKRMAKAELSPDVERKVS